MHESGVQVTDDEVKQAWLERLRKTYEATLATANARNNFESRIRRRWWHYKPLDPEQLLTWWLFLDDVQAKGDEHATYGLFERCLVPCASYPGAPPCPCLPAVCAIASDVLLKQAGSRARLRQVHHKPTATAIS